MASLKELKGRIGSVKSTRKITQAKKMVAAAKLRRAQTAIEQARAYCARLEKLVADFTAKPGIASVAPPLLAGTGSDAIHLLLILNSDRGLAGAFNSNIVKAARNKALALKAEGKTVRFFLVGRKGRPVIDRLFPGDVIEYYDTLAMREAGFAQAQEIAAKLMAYYEAGAFDIAHLFYSKFRSALVQEAKGQQIIPLLPAASDSGAAPKTEARAAPKTEAGAAPKTEARAAPKTETGAAPKTETGAEYEPDEKDILAVLLPRGVRMRIFEALLENAASEQGASMTAMDNATRNAGDLINKLTIEYNRSRQAAITTELVEIISGAEAL